MKYSAVRDLFDRNYETGETIFHELAKLGALRILYRIQELTTESFDDLLQLENNRGKLCTHVAAKYHNGFLAIDLIEVLVAMGADLNGRNGSTGETVLHGAVHNGDYELAEWLCGQPGMDLGARNYNGLTAYQLAYKLNDVQLKRILQKAGADCEELEETASEFSDEE